MVLVLKVVFRVESVIKVFFFADVTRLSQRVRVAEVREIEAAVHVDAHIVLFLPSPFLSCVVPFFQTARNVGGTRVRQKESGEEWRFPIGYKFHK